MEKLGSLFGVFTVLELRKKLLITLSLIVVFRMGTYVTIPGIDSDELSRLFEQFRREQSGLGRLMGMANMFSGGAIAQAAVFSLGIMPYITASILFQILATVYPSLKKLQKEGEGGRRKLNQYTRYATLVICVFQASMICRALEQPMDQIHLVKHPGMVFMVTGVVALTAGTMIVMWLGEMITEFGLGNGSSLIIMAGIMAHLPIGLADFAQQLMEEGGSGYLTVAFLMGFFLAMVIGIVYTTLGQRRIPIRQQRRVVAAETGGGLRQYLPLRVNMAGVIPIIFAQSIIMFPAFLGQLPHLHFLQDAFKPGQLSWTVLYLVLIVFFCFFYTSMVFNPSEMADNMKQGGTFIPGIRPGQETARFLETLLIRITVVGAVVLAVIAIVPHFLSASLHISYALAGIFGGTGLLIVVGVALDLIQKIEGHLLTYNFDALVESPRARRA